jgi:argininosuccinate lyase
MISGRITATPDELLHALILEPQFTHELGHLLPFYLAAERVWVREAYALGLISHEEATGLLNALGRVDAEKLLAHPAENLSDLSFAIERAVTDQLGSVIPSWHVDKSRNDFQACAQRMLARQRLLDHAPLLEGLGAALARLAERTRDLPMPGYTHYQAAQVISPGFYLAAIGEAVLWASRRLCATYDEINRCPLGSGAMAGLELPWDRASMAAALGFDAPIRSALVGVADRDWTLKVGSEFTLLGTTLSRFCTDLSAWGSGALGFIDLPDALAGISSAMPQKRNFTILERIRGETAHLAAFTVDFLLGQRNTPYTNLVEVSKEAGRYVVPLFDHADRIVQLVTLVVQRLEFRPERLREACAAEYCGGFALANALTLRDAVPARTAQILVGEYIRDAIAQGISPDGLQVTTLQEIGARHGYAVSLDEESLRDLFDASVNLAHKRTLGSTHPDEVARLLREQAAERENLRRGWEERAQRVAHALSTLDVLPAQAG